MVKENSKDLSVLRDQGSTTERNFYKISVENSILESKIYGMKTEREMRIT